MTRKFVKGQESGDVVSMMAGLVEGWLTVEFSYYKMIDKPEVFVNIWEVSDFLCSVKENMLIVFF